MANDFSSIVEAFVAVVVLLAISGQTQYINLAVNLFVYSIVDSVEGRIAALIVGAVTFGWLRKVEGQVSIGGIVISISAATLAGIIVQYILIH